MSDVAYHELFPLGPDDAPYRKLTGDHVMTRMFEGQQVWTGGDDAAALSAGICRTYTETNLRYSQVAPLSMYEEVNTGDNLPAQIDLYAEPGDQYKFLFIAKGGGSANKSFLYQQT